MVYLRRLADPEVTQAVESDLPPAEKSWLMESGWIFVVVLAIGLVIYNLIFHMERRPRYKQIPGGRMAHQHSHAQGGGGGG
eukprot:m.47659 g.47659  ORF g.47659 m.47659 type:complete len:81 (+) comp10522_c0_seq3:229-471(+)